MKTKDATLPAARLTRADKRTIKSAARIKGKSMSNWVVECTLAMSSHVVSDKKFEDAFDLTKRDRRAKAEGTKP